MEETPLTLRGNKTPRTVIYKSESQKLCQAFNLHGTTSEGVTTYPTIYKGHPVKLETDGTISPYTGTGVYLGIALTDSINPAYGAQKDYPVEVTVAVRGYAIINMAASAALSAGYVKPTGTIISNRFTQVQASESDLNLISLNSASAAGDLVQVLCK